MEDKPKKHYKTTDCLLIDACKKYYRDKKRSAVYDKFARFLCAQANEDGAYSKFAEYALDREREIMDLCFSWEQWCTNLVVSACFVRESLSRVKNGQIKGALSLYISIQNMIIRNSDDLKEGRTFDICEFDEC